MIESIRSDHLSQYVSNVYLPTFLRNDKLGLLTKSFNRRWGLYIIKHNQLIATMNGNSVIQLVGYVIPYFENGREPVHPWDLYLRCANGGKILIENKHFTSSGNGVTPFLIQQIQAIDDRWNEFNAGEVWCEDATTKQILKVSEYTEGNINVQAMFDDVKKPRQRTFISILNEAFDRKYA